MVHCSEQGTIFLIQFRKNIKSFLNNHTPSSRPSPSSHSSRASLSPMPFSKGGPRIEAKLYVCNIPLTKATEPMGLAIYLSDNSIEDLFM
jgi:hypothetical protein